MRENTGARYGTQKNLTFASFRHTENRLNSFNGICTETQLWH